MNLDVFHALPMIVINMDVKSISLCYVIPIATFITSEQAFLIDALIMNANIILCWHDTDSINLF